MPPLNKSRIGNTKNLINVAVFNQINMVNATVVPLSLNMNRTNSPDWFPHISIQNIRIWKKYQSIIALVIILLIHIYPFLLIIIFIYVQPQLAKKVVSDSPGLVDFAIGLVNSVLNLPEGQVSFFGKFKLQKNCNQCCSSKNFSR